MDSLIELVTSVEILVISLEVSSLVELGFEEVLDALNAVSVDLDGINHLFSFEELESGETIRGN